MVLAFYVKIVGDKFVIFSLEVNIVVVKCYLLWMTALHMVNCYNVFFVHSLNLLAHLCNRWLDRSALDGECGFLAANLYAKSVFGEDALVNISIEKQLDGKLSGYIRIRSKTQGIALSLGDKITLKQKGGS